MIRRALYLALFLALSCGLVAKDKEKLPTVDVISAKKLGDFWGVEFPTEGAEREGGIGFSLYLDHQGEVIIKFYYSGKAEGQRTPWYYLLYHVGQRKLILKEKGVSPLEKGFSEMKQEKFIRENELAEIKDLPLKVAGSTEGEGLGYIKTSRSHRWILISGLGSWSKCSPPLADKIRVKDLQGGLIAEKALVYASSTQKRWHHSAPACPDEGNGLGRPRQLSVSNLTFFSIWQVDDGTVLAETADAPYLIRLTPTLTSPFLDRHPDLHFIEADMLAPLSEKFRAEREKTLKPNEDIYEKVDEDLFRFVQQHRRRFPSGVVARP